ncbi:sulfatase-like hydrolase/transferase [Ottowia sp.]|uniref:sulfatase-like hydrolase/transferase n=1 Tax=Ottowia sp. TaxID=1898956 RepID=UPI00261FCD6C|nr:sulfatase-like hydrolase/transferase [Ottowia sp.]
MSAASVLLALALLAVWPRRRWQWWLGMAVSALAVVLTSSYAVADHFTGEGITLAVLAHLLYGWRDGELGLMRFPWVAAGVLAGLLGWMLWGWWCWRLMRGRARAQKKPWQWLALPVGGVAILSNPAAQDLWLLQRTTEHQGQALNAELQWDVKPGSGRPRPFVWIYLESLERAFLDQERLPGVAPGLAVLEQENLSFRGIATAPFMNWTVAGMVASQCGMPFEPLGKQGTGYKAGAACLGDWLSDHGYVLSYVGGADLAFSGKGRFYRRQGFSTVLGFDDLKGDAKAHSVWGVYDDVVFARAQREFMRLKQSGQLFGLVILTTATHPPEGYVSASCRDRENFGNPMLGAVHCSDGQVVELVRWLQANGPNDLLIILGSAHLQVAGSAHDILRRAARRENTLIVLGAGQGVVDRPATMVDVAPTVAELLGFDARAIGLGRSLLRKAPTLTEAYGYGKLISMLPGWRVSLREGDSYALCQRQSHAQPKAEGASWHITQALCKTEDH